MQLGDYNDTVGVNDAVCESTGTAVLCKCNMQNILNEGNVVTTTPVAEAEEEVVTTTEATTTIMPNGRLFSKSPLYLFEVSEISSLYE